MNAPEQPRVTRENGRHYWTIPAVDPSLPAEEQAGVSFVVAACRAQEAADNGHRGAKLPAEYSSVGWRQFDRDNRWIARKLAQRAGLRKPTVRRVARPGRSRTGHRRRRATPRRAACRDDDDGGESPAGPPPGGDRDAGRRAEALRRDRRRSA